MGKTSDILKELEDIGAVGDKIQTVVIRRPMPVLVFEPKPKPLLVPEAHDVVAGFAVQLENLEDALRSMLDWCAIARQTLLTQGDAEEVREEQKVQEVLSDEVQGNETELPVPEEPGSSTDAVVLKPKLSLAEIRKHFLDPEFQVVEVPANGAAKGAPVVSTTEMEKPNE